MDEYPNQRRWLSPLEIINFSFIAGISEVGHPDHGEEKPSHKDVK